MSATIVADQGEAPPPRTLVDVVVAAYALGLLVLWAPVLYWGLLTPRVALVFIATGPGLVIMVVLAARGDLAARLALALIGWVSLAALASDDPGAALIGSMGEDRGWLYVTGALASWAIGRRVSVIGRRLVLRAVVLGLAINVSVALMQALLHPDGALRPVDGRMDGLTANAVMFGGLVVGALAMVGTRAIGGGRWWMMLPLAAVLGATANLSGSRAAVGVGAVMLVLPAVTGRIRARQATSGEELGTRAELLRLVALLAALFVGVLASTAVDLGTSSVSRADGPQASSGLVPRAHMWSAGLAATAERPVLGWGPGQFRAATSRRVTASFARAEGPDRLFFDAHNIVVEILTTTGVVGLVLSIAFLLAAARVASGPLAWFALGVGSSWLLTPVSTVTTPIAFLALGVATVGASRTLRGPSSAREPLSAPLPRPALVGAFLLALVGGAAGGRVLFADHLVYEATKSLRVEEVQRAQALLPPDVVLSSIEQAIWLRLAEAAPLPTTRAGAVRAARRSVALDPARPFSWAQLGYVEANQGAGDDAARLRRAERAFGAALDRNPWSAAASQGMWQIAVRRDDVAEERYWRDRLCQLDRCPRRAPPPP